MKRSILMLLAIAVALIFFGCEKEAILPPDLDQDALEESALKGAKVKGEFTGICTFVEPVPNTWHDETGDWRTTGTTIWEQAKDGFYGTAELTLDAIDKNGSPAGKWEMTWTGSVTPTPENVLIVATATGVGVEGYVKGMKANWTYTMNYTGLFPFDPPDNPFDITHPSFFYVIDGKYYTGPVKRNGPKHLR